MPHTASAVILVRPTAFGFDPETAQSNAFQQLVNDPDIRRLAEEEFDGLLHELDRSGIGTTVLDPVDPTAPNAVFPNNWFSTHADGTVVLYPMCTPSRRRERDRALDETLEREGFHVNRLVDLCALEQADRFLEGTGSLVLDRVRNVAYAALSPRTSERGLNVWCGVMDGHQVPFLATMDGTLAGQPVYHTNVVLSIGEGFAVVCTEAMPYPVDREDVQAELERAGKVLIPITLRQMHQYVGNLLQLRSPKGPAILLSTAAFGALDPVQRRLLEAHGQLVPVPVPTIEAVGGGSVRCMLAENFLPLLGA
ncbi:MAG TPA: arginine deiminase-related protein [Flavobacteriales bacterium]|nr:amidinotransferase [Flavobacteriales bacterium]HQW87690.1 arginine deiminase-related protein [Flavobacteriales bacterium]